LVVVVVVVFVGRGVLWYLTSFSTKFQLYRDGEFSRWMKIADLLQVTDTVYHIMFYRVHLALA
jgi:hypothetical protein